MTVRILTGDCLHVLRTLLEASVHCCVTSPPYYGLRDYGTGQWEGGDPECDHGASYREQRQAARQSGVDGGMPGSLRDPPRNACRCGAVRVDRQIGLEPSPAEYIAKMVEVFREVRRVLRPDGTVWLNLGDSYAANRGYQVPDSKHIDVGNSRAMKVPDGMKPKDLMMIPARVALALQAPQHYGPIRQECDRAWLAAFIDGEGTISIARNVAAKSRGGDGHCQAGYTPFICAGNQDVELVQHCAEITGYGRVILKDRPSIDNRQIVSRRDYMGWRIDARQAVSVLRDVYPFLIAKRKQAVIAYNLSLSNDGGRALRGNGPLPRSEQEKREHLKLLINACNQRKQVDMPSWLIEPPSNFEQGWWLRSEIVWSKPNPMPESVTDRPTSAHEKVYLLAKAERYFFDAEAVREPSEYPEDDRKARSANGQKRAPTELIAGIRAGSATYPTRNVRNVWTIATAPFPEAHFATFPPELAERCIKAGTSERGCCAKCGAPWGRVTAVSYANPGNRTTNGPRSLEQRHETAGFAVRLEKQTETTGWQPTCSCAAAAVPCTVLDPFGGAGTSGLVADRLGRNAVLIELNTEYAAMARRRIIGDAPLFAEVAAD